jgi:FkbM family methyltransferase
MDHPLHADRKIWVLSEVDARLEAIATSPSSHIYGKIDKGDTIIVDVGANLGSWTLTAAQLAGPTGTVIAIEPVPEAFSCLTRNAAMAKAMSSGLGHISCLNVALGDERSEAESLTVFPRCCALSCLTRHRNDADAIEATLSIAGCFLKSRRLGFIASRSLYRWIHSFFVRVFFLSHSEEIRCKTTTLSQVIEEEGLLKVDLIKINVERGEEAVLRGVEDRHWPRIKAVTVQVHDLDGRVKRIGERLRGQFPMVRMYQEQRFVGCSLWMIEAKR